MGQGYDFTQLLDMLLNVSAYILDAFFTGSRNSLKGLIVGVFSKKLSKDLLYVFAQRSYNFLKPARVSRNVDFPYSLVPTIARNSPSSTSRFIPPIASTPPFIVLAIFAGKNFLISSTYIFIMLFQSFHHTLRNERYIEVEKSASVVVFIRKSECLRQTSILPQIFIQWYYKVKNQPIQTIFADFALFAVTRILHRKGRKSAKFSVTK